MHRLPVFAALLGLAACHHHVRPPLVLDNGLYEYSGTTPHPERGFAKFEKQATNFCAHKDHAVAVIDSREQMPTPRRMAIALRFHCGDVAGPVPEVMVRPMPEPPPPGAPPPPPGQPARDPNAMQELEEEEQ